MEINFKVLALALSTFNCLLSMSDDELRKNNAMWLNAESSHGYPCRVSLKDVEIGARFLAVSYEHNKTDSSYLSSGLILVQVKACEAILEVNEIF